MPGIYNACDAAAMTKCATGGVYHHNTIVVGGKWTACISDGPTADFAEFKNNICVHQGASGPLIEANKGTSDHNLFFGRQTFVRGGTTYSSLASYQVKSGQDSHSKLADPLFLDPTSHDYHLSGSSPAVDLSPSLGYLVDLDQKPTPVGAGADAGAFEHQGTGPPKDAAVTPDVSVDSAVSPDSGPGAADSVPTKDSGPARDGAQARDGAPARDGALAGDGAPAGDGAARDTGPSDVASTGEATPNADATGTVDGVATEEHGRRIRGLTGGCALGSQEPRPLAPLVLILLLLALVPRAPE